jgi:hypothetical protein
MSFQLCHICRKREELPDPVSEDTQPPLIVGRRNHEHAPETGARCESCIKFRQDGVSAARSCHFQKTGIGAVLLGLD